MATAVLSTLHEGSEVQLQRAFAAAKMSSPAEATFEPDRNRALHDVPYYLSVTADTPERARADLATLTDTLRAAFPSAERNLMVSLNNSTVPAPNDLSRRISFGVQAAVVLLMLGAQLLILIGAHREGMGRAGLFAALATPSTILIFPTTGTRRAMNYHNTVYTADWKFVLLLLALTPGTRPRWCRVSEVPGSPSPSRAGTPSQVPGVSGIGPVSMVLSLLVLLGVTIAAG